MNLEQAIGLVVSVLVGQGVLRVILERWMGRGERKNVELQLIIDNLRKDNDSLRTEVQPLRTLNAELAARDAQKEVQIVTLRAQASGLVQRLTACELEREGTERELRKAEELIRKQNLDARALEVYTNADRGTPTQSQRVDTSHT